MILVLVFIIAAACSQLSEATATFQTDKMSPSRSSSRWSSFLSSRHTALHDHDDSSLSSFSSSSLTKMRGKMNIMAFVGKMDGVVNVKDYGAVGDGVTDDSTAIQSAVNMCRQSSLSTPCTVYFPPAEYATFSAIDFTNWLSFSVIGGGDSGGAGIGDPVGVSLITGVSNKVAFDFSGSAYGYVSGIAFQKSSSATPSAFLLLARLADGSANHSTYGSDIVFERCNIGGFVGIASIIVHSAEVITWNNCRFAANDPHPSLLYTCHQQAWGYDSVFQPGRLMPIGYCSQTMHRVSGGELVDAYNGQENAFILIDSPDWGSADFFFHDLYVGCGPNMHLIELRNNVFNVDVSNIRFENILTNGQTSGGDWSLIHLNGGALIQAHLEAVNFANVADLITVSASGGSVSQAIFQALNSSPTFSGGGFIQYMAPLFRAGTVNYLLPNYNGKFAASFSGNFVEFYVSASGLNQPGSSIQHNVTSTNSNTNYGQGSLFFGDLSCNALPASQATYLCANFVNNGDWFIVRRFL